MEAPSPAADGAGHLRLTEEINAIIEQKKLKHEASREPQLGHSDRHARSALEEAAQEAAIADGVLPMSLADIDKHDGGTRCKHALRRGKWTPEEEAYARRLIEEFKRGNLPLSEGTTLRTFLSKLLNCDPMRISKKFVGHNCIGKQVFRRRTPHSQTMTDEMIEASRRDLAELERRFLDRINQTSRTKAPSRPSGNSTPKSDSGKSDSKGPAPASAAATLAARPPLGAANLGGHLDHHHFPNFPPHTLPWTLPPHNMVAGLPVSLPLGDTNGQHTKTGNGLPPPKGGDKPHGRQLGGMHAPTTNGFPAAAFDQSGLSQHSFPRTPSMEVLMNLPNMSGMPSIPSLPSMENMATFSLGFSQMPGFAPQPGSMPWENLPFHGGYDIGGFPVHNHDSVMGGYMLKSASLQSFSDASLAGNSKGPADQQAWTGMEPPASRPSSHNLAGLTHATSTDEFLALMENHDHDSYSHGNQNQQQHQQQQQYPPPQASTTRSRAANTTYDPRHQDSLQGMNKAEFQTSGKRRYEGSGSSGVVKAPRSTLEPAYAQADL